MANYEKGARCERELINMLSEKGYSVIRAAGSGVSSVCPDIVAFKRGESYAFECKAWDKGSIGIEKKKMKVLKEWENNSGITTMLAWRMGRIGWRFVHLEEMEEKGKSFTITSEKVLKINRKFEDVAR